jgi:hypothetical protein
MKRFAYLAAFLLLAPSAQAYVEVPMTLGSVIQQSVVVCSMVVTKVDKTNNLIIYQKVADIKGKSPDTIKHNIGRGGLRPGEWQNIMNWAEVGKSAIFFHNGGASETFIGGTWYQAYPNGEWWGMSHEEPFLLRSFAGKPDKLAAAVKEIVAGKEIVVGCMVDGDKEALHKKTAKLQKMKASIKLLDYNPKRDFVGWGGGGDEIRGLSGMPGFDKIAGLGRTEADAQSVSVIDFEGNGKPGICLCGANKVALFQQADDGFSEITLPGLVGGARSAVWADYNGDGLPDLLLATPNGPKLYTNLGKAAFRDDSKVLPKETAYNLTAAAWGDFDGDGKPDILLANGFHGLRLYKNIRKDAPAVVVAPPKIGPWYAVGPFRHKDGPQKNFETDFGPETETKLDLNKVYKGKRDVDVKWVQKEYPDATVNDLAAFAGTCAIYLYREIEAAADMEYPVSMGSDDTLTVWVNGEKIHSENVTRKCEPDSAVMKFKLKAGKNRVLLKICNNDMSYAFYFAHGNAVAGAEPCFRDISAEWGLGDSGLASDIKGDSLAVADFNNDGKLDFLFGAGTGFMFQNMGGKFELRDSGINYRTGKVGPALGDFDGDGLVDLFVPQTEGSSKLYRNLGNFKFEDVTARTGDLSKPLGYAVGAAWGDFDNDGKPDLLVTCLKGTNKYFKNMGDGTFAEKSVEVGLNQKVFNTQAAAFADLNNDGRLDLVLNNEGQESCILFGGPADASKLTPVVVKLPKETTHCGGTVSVTTHEGKIVASTQLYGCDGRGGQGGIAPRFALAPGLYTVVVKGSDGKTKQQSLTVAKDPMRVVLD